MTYEQAIQHFGSATKLARALGVAVPSVMEWKSGIPELRQFQIQLATDGQLQSDTPARRDTAQAA